MGDGAKADPAPSEERYQGVNPIRDASTAQSRTKKKPRRGDGASSGSLGGNRDGEGNPSHNWHSTSRYWRTRQFATAFSRETRVARNTCAFGRSADLCDFLVTRRTYSHMPLSRLRIATLARLAFTHSDSRVREGKS